MSKKTPKFKPVFVPSKHYDFIQDLAGRMGFYTQSECTARIIDEYIANHPELFIENSEESPVDKPVPEKHIQKPES